jgi:hypothetical protein
VKVDDCAARVRSLLHEVSVRELELPPATRALTRTVTQSRRSAQRVGRVSVGALVAASIVGLVWIGNGGAGHPAAQPMTPASGATTGATVAEVVTNESQVTSTIAVMTTPPTTAPPTTTTSTTTTEAVTVASTAAPTTTEVGYDIVVIGSRPTDLGTLSAQYGCEIDDIVALNGWDDGWSHTFFTGDKVKIPRS